MSSFFMANVSNYIGKMTTRCTRKVYLSFVCNGQVPKN